MSTSPTERLHTIRQHALALADEAHDAEATDLARRLVARATRARGHLDELAQLEQAQREAGARCRQALEHLKASLHQLELVARQRAPTSALAVSLASARLGPTATAMFRLQVVLDDEARSRLASSLERVAQGLVHAREGEWEVLAATTKLERARAQAVSFVERSRERLELHKSELLATLPPGPAAGRVRRRVVRTRRRPLLLRSESGWSSPGHSGTGTPDSTGATGAIDGATSSTPGPAASASALDETQPRRRSVRVTAEVHSRHTWPEGSGEGDGAGQKV